MKRWFTAALALVMTFSSTPAGMMAARAEESALEAYVPEAEGLTLGDEETAEESAAPLRETPDEATEEVIELEESEAVESEAVEAELASAAQPTSIKLNFTSGTIGVGETFNGLFVIASPEGASTEVTWTSSKTKVVQVDPVTGALTGIKTGSATITATTPNGKKATCKVKVKKGPTSITVSPSSMKLGYGGVSSRLGLKFSSGSACSTVYFTSSDPGVATVDAYGTVTSVGSGTAVITATAYNGVSDSCEVTVLGAPASLVFEKSTLNVGAGQTATLEAQAYDRSGNPAETGVTYSLVSASPRGCVSVSADGKVKASASGTAVVRGTTANGLTATCNVAVVAMPVAIKLNQSTGMLAVGETYTGLTATLISSDGSDSAGEVIWTSSKPKIVYVDEDTGALTALKTGTAVITAQTSGGLKDTCKVTVKKAPTSISLSPETLKLSAGGMSQELGVILSKNSALGGLSFTSSNTNVARVNSDGIVTSVGEGTAVITATTFNGKTAKCTVTVAGEPASVVMDHTAISVGMGDKGSVSATPLTASGNVAGTNLTYYIESNSPNPGCIKLDADTGAVTAVSGGTAYVNVRTHNGITAAQSCVVTVTAKPKALSLPSKLTVGVGDTLEALEAVLTFQDGTTGPATGLTWSSSNKKVVAVDAATGTLTALKKGTATITAKTSGGLKDTCKITVSAAPTGLTLSPSAVKLSAGGMKFQLAANVTGVSAADVSFSSSNPAVATVSNDGVITTVSAGKATITGKTYNGKTATCAVTVTSVPAKASFSTTQMTLGTDETVIPDVKVQAADGSEAVADLNFRILAGPQYISLNSATGEITAKEAGTAVVGVSTHNGVSASNTCTITVVAEATDISLSQTSASLGAGEIVQLKARVKAVKGANTGVSWSSSNTKVAKVSAAGVVTAVAAGSATITAQTANGLKATCKVTVYKAPTSISLSPASGSVYVGEAGQYVVKVSSGAGGYVSFTSSDPDIAEVDDEGVVVGIYPGTVTITATTYNGKKATAKLTVKRRSTSTPSYDDYGDDEPSGGDYEYDETIERVIALAESQLGKPYKSKGGYKDSNPSGFDCSGLVYWCYYQVGIKLGDSPSKQANDSKYTRIDSISDLQRGDVVCFKSDSSSSVSHTGIYRGDGEFIHASSAGKAVIITDINKDYYSRNFVCGRRIIE